MVPCWATDGGVSGSNPFGALFEILHFVRDLYSSFENSMSNGESCPYVQIIVFRHDYLTAEYIPQVHRGRFGRKHR